MSLVRKKKYHQETQVKTSFSHHAIHNKFQEKMTKIYEMIYFVNLLLELICTLTIGNLT